MEPIFGAMYPRYPSLILILTILGICRSVEAQHGTEPIFATDLLRVQTVGDVSIAPDGRQVLYTVTSVVDTSETADAYEYRTHLFLVDGSSAVPPRQLTRGNLSARSPAWHPNGDRIAFVREVDGKPQIFVLPLLGGEAYQVTRAAFGATEPRWSPDGTRILYTAKLKEHELRELTNALPEWASERPGRAAQDSRNANPDPNGSLAEIRAWLDANADDGNPKTFHRLDFLGEMELEPSPSFRHFFVVEAESPDAEPVQITRGFADYSAGAWMSDERIIVAGTGRSDLHPDHVRDTDLFAVNSDGSNFGRILDLEGYALSSPLVAPDRRTIAFLARDTEDVGYSQTELGVFSLSDPAGARLVTLDFDRSVSNPSWSKDGWYLYFTAPSNGGVPLYRVRPFDLPIPLAAPDTLAADSADILVDAPPVSPPDTVSRSTVERLTPSGRGIQSFDVGRATIVFAATEVANPSELYASDLTFTEETRLTSHNTGWLADKRLSFPEGHTITRDSLEIDYWIMKPTFFDPERTYPLLVEIHGGPSAMWGPGEATMWHEFQFFASRGYGLVFSNPRGSGGYGYDFKRANYQDWGGGPAGDVLAAATQAARLPWVDESRQVVAGGSYAGYLTAWIVAHDDRFRAAVAQRGVYDLGTFLGEGNAWRLVPTHFGGYPWERDAAASELPMDTTVGTVPGTVEMTFGGLPVADAGEVDRPTSDKAAESFSEILIRNSPLTYVDRITTPLLIMHSDQDLRTGVAQSEVLYKSLKILGRPVEYVRYGKSGHDLSRTGDPLLRIDRILRMYEFMERFVR